MSDYPEHNKLAAIKDQSQAQGELLEWLFAKGWRLCRWSNEDNVFLTSSWLVEDMLAEYHGIDLAVLDQEKRAMLEAQRQRNREATG